MPKKLTKAEVDQVIAKLPKGYVSKAKKGATKKGLDFGALAQLIQTLWAIFQTIKPPKPPAPAPTPEPTPTPTPTPVPPTPVPPVTPPPVNADCPKPDGIKLGFRDQPKISLGYRNQWNISPTVGGVPVKEGCGEFYYNTYGEPEAFQKGPGFDHDPVERASGNSFGCIARIATNSEDLWVNGKFTQAGKYTLGVSYPWLNFWRCQDFTIGEDGKATGVGNNTQSYNLPK